MSKHEELVQYIKKQNEWWENSDNHPKSDEDYNKLFGNFEDPIQEYIPDQDIHQYPDPF